MSNELSICVLGFGSLLEHQYSDATCAELQVSTPFAPTGFCLPINLTQIVGKGGPYEHLSLVIDSDAPTNEPVYYAVHKFKSLSHAIRNLKERENTKTKNIGYFNVNNGRFRARVHEILPTLKDFCIKNYFDAVIWTDSAPNFRFNAKSPDHSSIQIQKYLKARPRVLSRTQEYLRKLPPVLINSNPLLLKIYCFFARSLAFEGRSPSRQRRCLLVH